MAEDRLRDALEDVLSTNHSPFLGSDGNRPCVCVVHENARVALASQPSAAPPSGSSGEIDVERLARAAGVDCGCTNVGCWDAIHAEHVAREYASPSAGESPSTDPEKEPA